MKRVIKRVLLGLLVLFVLASGFVIYYLLDRVAPVGVGYKAKMLSSYLFVQDRELEGVMQNDLEPFNPLLRFVGSEVDYDNQTVTSKFLGVTRTAVYREGLGSTIIPAGHEGELPPNPGHVDALPANPEEVSWPMGDLDAFGPLPAEVDQSKLEEALDREFAEPDPDNPRRARAVVVVYNGNIIAERYAPGFSKDTPMHGWSMTKSITSALVGILAGEGKIKVGDPAPIEEWRKPEVPHRKITVEHLLHMSAGFEFYHDLSPAGQRQQVLFGGIDSVEHSLHIPLDAEPGTRFEYANANVHCLWKIIRNVMGEDNIADYISFPRRALFNQIGMRSAIIEPDPYWNFIGTSFGWATARDWARFGLLYLNDGVWEGERILPKGWVEYTTTPAPADPLKQYGALFWLNAGRDEHKDIAPEDKGGRNVPPFPRVPVDAYFAVGHDGQRIAIIPSKDLVVVRLGLSRAEETWDYEGFLVDILDAIGD